MTPRTRTAPDQYNALTARLIASGYQIITMRVIAAAIMAMAAAALLAAIAPREVPWTGFRIAYQAMALIDIAMAVPWLRYRWPSRLESSAVVIVGAITLAFGCLMTIEPVAGLVVASAFTAVLGFAALFHRTELLIFVSVIAALTMIWLAVRIAATDVAAAIALTTPVVLQCALVAIACRTIAQVAARADERADLEPLTGLPTSAAFYEGSTTLIGGRHSTDDQFFVVAVVAIDNLAVIQSVHGGRGYTEALVDAGMALREAVRRDAVVSHASETEFLIAATFTDTDPRPLVEGVLSAVAATPSGITASIGAVSTPLRPLIDSSPDGVLEELIALANSAMSEARRSGGNTARYVLDPPLASL